MESKYSIRRTELRKSCREAILWLRERGSRMETGRLRHFTLKVLGKERNNRTSRVRQSWASVPGRGRYVFEVNKEWPLRGSAKVSAIATIYTGHFTNVPSPWRRSPRRRSMRPKSGAFRKFGPDSGRCEIRLRAHRATRRSRFIWPWGPSVVWKECRELKPSFRKGTYLPLKGDHVAKVKILSALCTEHSNSWLSAHCKDKSGSGMALATLKGNVQECPDICMVLTT